MSCAFPVGVDLVILLEDACEMANAAFVDVLHTKIINSEGETDGAPIVLPVSWCDSALALSCFVKAFGEEVLHNDASLWETGHSTLQFEFHPEVLVVIHGRHEVGVHDIDGHKLCIGHRDDAVE